jgi:hypothetical protein
MEFTKFITEDGTAKSAELIDPCAFKAIVAHYLHPDSDIQEVLILDESLDLAQIGSFFQFPVENGDYSKAVLELLGSGKLRYALPALLAETKTNPLLFDEIGFDRMVYVIRAEPFYLVKLTDKIWN